MEFKAILIGAILTIIDTVLVGYNVWILAIPIGFIVGFIANDGIFGGSFNGIIIGVLSTVLGGFAYLLSGTPNEANAGLIGLVGFSFIIFGGFLGMFLATVGSLLIMTIMSLVGGYVAENMSY